MVNLGTPDAPDFFSVARYLTQFLNDKRVIDIPAFFRFLLVNLIIVPFRSRKSSKAYQRLWKKNNGVSPLLKYGLIQQQQLQEKLGQDYTVELAMRYQNPSLTSVLERMQKVNYQKIIILPLFPQYASASGGSAIEETLRIIQKWWVIPTLEVISDFYDHPLYIEAMAEKAKNFDFNQYDQILFSYHGLPIRQLDKTYAKGLCADHPCETEINAENRFCYVAQCYATTRSLAKKLNIPEDKYQVVFQSRLGKEPWTEPFAEDVVIQLAKSGLKKVLFFSPAFVSDCLETELEIAEEYLEIFQEYGGEHLDLVPSLNDSTRLTACLQDLVLSC